MAAAWELGGAPFCKWPGLQHFFWLANFWASLALLMQLASLKCNLLLHHFGKQSARTQLCRPYTGPAARRRGLLHSSRHAGPPRGLPSPCHAASALRSGWRYRRPSHALQVITLGGWGGGVINTTVKGLHSILCLPPLLSTALLFKRHTALRQSLGRLLTRPPEWRCAVLCSNLTGEISGTPWEVLGASLVRLNLGGNQVEPRAPRAMPGCVLVFDQAAALRPPLPAMLGCMLRSS